VNPKLARKFVFLVALLSSAFAAANTPTPLDPTPLDPTKAIRISQAAIGSTVGDFQFIDQDGKPLRLAELQGRPVLVSFIYTSCAFVCPMLIERLRDVVKVANDTLGENSFTVLTIGFDTAVDTPERMRVYARERRVTNPNWRMVSADAPTIAAVSKAVGFQFVRLGGGFDHVAQVTVLDAQGVVFAQAYGPDFDPPAIIDPLKRLALGQKLRERPLAELLRTVRLLCTTYDPKSGRYRFDYSLILEIAIGLTLAIGVGAFLVHAWRQR